MPVFQVFRTTIPVTARLFWLLFLLPLSAGAEDRLRVEISGLPDPMVANVRAHLSLTLLEEPSGIGVLLTRGSENARPRVTAHRVRELYEDAPGEIREALRPFGYYDPVIESDLDFGDELWLARFDVDLGEPVVIQSLKVDIEGPGADDTAIEEAVSAITLEEGEPLDHARYDRDKEALRQAALRAGYLDAAFTTHALRVDPAAREAWIELVLKTGPQYYFGSITIEQSILKPVFIQRYVRIKPGEPFDTRRLVALQSRLAATEYFQSVEVDPQREDAVDQRVPVVIKTIPRKPRRYAFGAGFSTDTGPRVNANVKFRRVNRRGHQITLDARASLIKQGVGAQYRIPIANVVKDRFVISATAEHEKVDEGETDRYVLGFSHDQGWLGAQRRLYANFSRENFSLGDDDDKVDFLIPGFNLSAVRADDVLFARRGLSLEVDVRGGSDQVLSETTFVRGEAAGHLALPLGERGRILARLRAGGMRVDDFLKLPPTERFFAGGDQSVRGYDYRSLGPTDASGENIGGEYLLVGSVEADYLVYGDFGVAAFFDAGNAADHFPPDLKRGVGVGLRYRTPAGMAKLDFAWPLDEDAQFRIHISFGSGL